VASARFTGPKRFSRFSSFEAAQAFLVVEGGGIRATSKNLYFNSAGETHPHGPTNVPEHPVSLWELEARPKKSCLSAGEGSR